MANDILIHYGTKGQKWGIRRYQYTDGSLTPAGKKKYGTKTNFEKIQSVKRAGERKNSKEVINRQKANARTEKEIAKLKKKYGMEEEKPEKKEMSIDELRDATAKLQAKNAYDREMATYMNNHREPISKGKKFVNSMVNDVMIPASKTVGKKFVEQKLGELMGVKVEKDKKDNDNNNNQNNKNNNQNNNSNKKNRKNKQDDNSGNSNPSNDRKTGKAYERAEKEAAKRYENMREEARRNDTESDWTDRTETYTGTVEGKGTSKYTPPKGDTVNGQWRNVDPDIKTSDPQYRSYANSGADFYNQFLLEGPTYSNKKRKRN